MYRRIEMFEHVYKYCNAEAFPSVSETEVRIRLPPIGYGRNISNSLGERFL